MIDGGVPTVNAPVSPRPARRTACSAFEFLYLLRQRRLRHPEARRSTAEMQLFGDRDEVTEPSEIDTHMTHILIEHVVPIGHM
jgi:hypothetical protein